MLDEEEFDILVQRLQKEIIYDARNSYSEKVIEEWLHPKNWGRMDKPNAYGIMKGSCGDTIEFYLQIEREKISNVSFITDGCGPTIACGSRLTKLVKDKSVEDANEIDAQSLIDAPEGLPDESLHSATLAITTLKVALQNWMETMKSNTSH